MVNLSQLSDRELLEQIYIILTQISRRLNSPEENANDFTMNIVANILADRLLNGGYGKK
jgi:hypothetical protein|nr:MAG TPA: hypothetical protein [Bacteriophage sp.]